MPRSEPIVGRKIRFALVGCGRIADKHFEALAEHSEHATLVAVCDTDASSNASAAARAGSPAQA